MNLRYWSCLLLILACSEFNIEDKDAMVQTPLTVEESFLHATEPSVDVLLVVDDTASMASEHILLQEGIPELVETLQLRAISWHLATITTDVTSEPNSILRGDPWVITSTLDDPAQHVPQMIDVGTQGRQPEAGLAAVLQALSPALQEGPNRGFRRPNAALHIIVISDGDDHSDDIIGGDASQTFLDFLAEQSAGGGEESHLTALVGPEPNGCSSTTGTALAGAKYIEVAEASDGFVQSICEIDFVALGEWIAAASQPENPSFPLQAQPSPNSIRVQVNESRWDTGWMLVEESNKIEFTDPPPLGAQIQVRYEVLSS